jgi:hypothetical protein
VPYLRERDPVPIVQVAGWCPECGKSPLHRDSIPGPSSPSRVAIPTALSQPIPDVVESEYPFHVHVTLNFAGLIQSVHPTVFLHDQLYSNFPVSPRTVKCPVRHTICNFDVVISLFLLTSLAFCGTVGYVSVKLRRLIYPLTIFRINDSGFLLERY